MVDILVKFRFKALPYVIFHNFLDASYMRKKAISFDEY